MKKDGLIDLVVNEYGISTIEDFKDQFEVRENFVGTKSYMFDLEFLNTTEEYYSDGETEFEVYHESDSNMYIETSLGELEELREYFRNN